MKRRLWIGLCLLALLAGLGVWRWSPASRWSPKTSVAPAPVSAAAAAPAAATQPVVPASVLNPTNRLAFRLSNTTKTLGQLTGDRHAILLANALIDTTAKLDLNIPAHLKAKGDPGAYIVQARGVIDARFRAALAAAGASVVSYIPNNAYLVRLSAAGAGGLSGNALVQAVLPFEPYYKLQPSLLGLAVASSPLPPGTALNVGLFAADAPATESQIAQLGFKIMGTDSSPFGPVLHVLAPADWTPLAQVPGVQVMEASRQRVLVNDLTRQTLGVAANTQTNVNFLGLTGNNVLVQVNDSGVDATHPDFSANRVLGLAGDLVDTAGHGTHVAGIIAGNGSKSTTVTYAEGSVSPYVTGQFRGMAPLANLYSISYGNSDYVLQTNAAGVGALISNNSWVYGGDYDYDLAAASYDAATRDAVPYLTGSQPVLFVFAAGDSGSGNDNGGGGSADAIESPGTAKNVITVGALEQLRNITNIVTTINSDGTTNTGTPWLLQTDSTNQVASYSSCGNVGVGTEGTYGRFKPDVVTPGTFVISTRSSQWDTNALLNPTNVSVITYPGQTVLTNGLNYYNVSVPGNAVAVVITLTSNALSQPFPANLPIYVQQSTYPDPVNAPGSIDITTHKDGVSIPPDSGGNISGIQSIQGNGFDFAVGDSTNVPVNYDMTVAIYTTNTAVSDYYPVLLGMDNLLGPYYRYETGTSMSAANVSGVLALLDDYFTNTLSLTPSPALLKAMLINGSRSGGGYLLAVTNGVNYQGWGLASLPNSLPLTNNTAIPVGPNPSLNSPLFFVDQSPANALATGDRHTYTVTINTNASANSLHLQATLVWTDPPGDPAAAIKLVNGLTLVITNLDTQDVYYGNDISSALGYNLPAATNGLPNLDTVNNVQNILLPPLLAGSYSVTVIGRAVNVNAVSAQTNNVVQDYALVVSVGEGEVPTAISSVVDNGILSNPTGAQDITFVATTNSPLLNQMVGANTPLLGTNTLPLGDNTVWGSNGQLTIGMTNQWHFYVVTNNALDSNGNSHDVTNAAFITFDAYDLSVPRMGVYADSVANATRPSADIDVYVSTHSSLTNLDPNVISNCLAGTVNSTTDSSGASVGQGGTEFVYFTNSAPGQVYYVGVKSEDQMASEYAFLPVFTATPFASLNQNGDLVVNGLLLPSAIPDGNPATPGVVTVFALAVPLIPNLQVADVTVTNLNEHQNFGDLFGALTFNTTSVVLNNHDGLGNTFGTLPLVYDDSLNQPIGTRHTDGPGSLMQFQGMSAIGPWILTEIDNSPGNTGQVSQLSLLIQPHRNFTGSGITNTIPPLSWFIDYVDVPPGYTNLTFFATNLPPTIKPQPVQMFERLAAEPTLTLFDQEADLTNCISGSYPTGVDPGNLISVGPPLSNGRYFIGLYNPDPLNPANVYLRATLGLSTTASSSFNYANTNGVVLLQNDAVTSDNGVFVSATQTIASVNVGLVVTSPQISDYTFTLVSPTGQRILLMENRGGSDTNGAGSLLLYTNIINSTAAGGAAANTNYLPVSPLGESIPITYNFYTVPDEMTVYEGTNPANFYPANTSNPYFLYDTGFTNNPSGGPGSQNTLPVTITVNSQPGYTNITIIMNQFGNPFAAGGDAWIYTAGAAITNYEYLTFTDDTNLANVPIKFAIPPYGFTEQSSNYTLCDFESATNGNYHGPTNIYDANGGWTVPTNLVTVSTVLNTNNSQFVQVTNVLVLTNNLVSVVTDPADSVGDNAGSNYLALANGTITRVISNTVPGHIYNVTFWFRGPGIASWWRGEGNASDSSDPENNANNGTLVGRFNFPAGEVGQAFGFEDGGNEFQFAGTNTYVQIPQNSSLDVGHAGGFTVEGWINPTNLTAPQPLVEWLSKVPTNSAVTNLVIKAGPYLDPATGHYYYLLGATNWTVSEQWAESLGGHLATIDTANEQNWVFDNFANYGGRNRNLWIGLTNNPASVTNSFGWSSGETNVTYLNWLSSQPTNCDGAHSYTFMYGGTNATAGLWTLADNNGLVCNSTNTTNTVYGVAEVNNIQTNGVQFWISVTNTPGTTNAGFFSSAVSTNGCLYANIIDTNYFPHEIYSAPGLLVSNVYQHVALTFDTNSGLAMLYLNGTNVATTNLFLTNGVFTPFVPKTDGDVLLGRDMSRFTNNYYGGEMDEMSIYRRALSGAEIAAIYRVSAAATNGLTGKFDPSVTPAYGLAEAEVYFGAASNLLFGVNDQWEENSYTFTATSNTMPLQITGLEPGILLDDFSVAEAPLTNLYYLPEQSLSALTGASAYGDWTLQVWDTRNHTFVTNSSLVSWQLSFILESNATFAATLSPETPTAGTVGPGQTVYFSVNVPSWAHFATNLLVSSSYPVNLFFNPTNLPTGSNPGDLTLLTGSTAGVGTPDLAVNSTFPLTAANQAGSVYYLGVQNLGTHAASVVLQVDYDITPLTNGLPLSSFLNTNDTVRYFSYTVSSNAYEATFQLLKLSGNADLVISPGVPLPTLTNSAYGSFNAGNLDENIYVLTNSTPVPLSAGTWYLGVVKRDSGVVNYTVLAKELDVTNSVTNSLSIVDLTNGVPFNGTAASGAALTNFFRLSLANNPALTNAPGVSFEVYNLTGNGDLTVQTNAPPLSPPFFQSSQNPRLNPELVLVFTNSALTNLAADWYLGVPNNETTNISFTILATIQTNGYFPAFPGATGVGGGAAGGGGPPTAGGHGTNGTVYHVINLNDSGPGSLRDAVSSTNRTVVFDLSGTINLGSPLVITNSYLTIAGQTAPGGGITVAGYMTAVSSAHDVIIRDLRFRRGAIDESLQLTNVFNLIADHVSAEWSDTVLSALNSSNVTVQWSIMADSLYLTNNPPPTGSLLRYGSGALSFNHNLYADNYSGSPQLGDNLSLDFVNNVIYNWGLFPGLTGGTNDLGYSINGCTNQLNYVCNYLIAGPDTASFGTNYAITNIAFFGGTTNALAANWIFSTNNFIDSDTNGILNGANTQWAMFTNQYTKFAHPFPLVQVPTDEAYLAYEKVLDFAGVNQALRDSVDTNIVYKVRTQTGRLISVSPVPGLVSWWRGEDNTLDSAGSNNGTPVGGINYTNGEVGQAFYFNGITNSINVPASASLNVGTGSGYTLACWIAPASATTLEPLMEWRGNGGGIINGSHFWLSVAFGGVGGPGCVYANIVDTGGGSHIFASATNLVQAGLLQHVALTYDKASGIGNIYYNGSLVASKNLGTFTPKTDTTLLLGNRLDGGTFYYKGVMDEAKIFSRALTQAEIQAVYNSATGSPVSNAQAYLDTDRDGLPDFWETTFGSNPTNADSYLQTTNASFIGYTRLEEYLAWLAGPHALTVTNTAVGVDLMPIFGKTGNLSFTVTNAINGTVYLTNVLGSVTNTGPWSNSIAVFTPTNMSPVFSGYAAFDVYVTNTTTVAYFGPVTVSVVVSAVPVTYTSTNTIPPMFLLTNATYYLTNNELVPLTVTNAATDVNTNLTLSYSLTMSIDTNAMALRGWVNSYANVTNTTPVISPAGVITWTPSEAQGPGVYDLATVVSDNGTPPLTATNTFIVTVNEVNTPPFWPTNVPSQTNYSIPALTTLVVSDTATDTDLPPNPLTYQLSVSPAAGNATIDTNGIVTWTPTLAQAPGFYTFTVIVTDTNPPAVNATSLSATNSFTVNVTTVAAPYAFTEPAQSVTGASAQLNGMATPNGLASTAWFQWGTSVLYGSTTPPVSVGNGYNVVYTTNPISGLVTNVAYHFRLVVSNLAGTNYGFDQILDEANVVVWGANFVGQKIVPPGLSNVVAVAGAYDHSFALKTDSTAVGWGDNTFGQMAVPAGLNSNLVAVAGGETYSLALQNSGTVFAWGVNIFPGETNVPAGLSNVVTIASGQYASLALKNDGNVAAWGASISGLTTVPAGLSNSAVAIAGGSFHNLAIRNDGTVVAWGDDSSGQTNLPAGLTNVVAIAAGGFHSLALKSDGTVAAWGDDSAGQTNVPAGLSNVVAVAAGGFHSLAMRNDGSVVAWGDNSAGQTNVPAGLTNFVAISAGYFHSLALTPQSVTGLTNLLNLSNDVSTAGSILAGGTTYYQISVPANADFATNLLLSADGPLNVWFTTNSPPSLAGNASLLLAGVTNGTSILSLTSVPTNIVPGTTYYLAVQNTNSLTVNYAIEVDFHLLPVVPVTISGIIYTNIGGTNGFLLTWFAPSNDLFSVQWTGSLSPTNWQTFTNIITYTSLTPTNGIGFFEFFDNGSQTGGTLGAIRFYRLILLNSASSNSPPVLPSLTNLTINPLNPLLVTNTATDATVPAPTLTYSIASTMAGTNQPVIGTNGVITWTPTVAQAGTSNVITTIVTASGVPSLSATNSFAVIVNPVPSLSSIVHTNGDFLLTWLAPTNDIFTVQVSTNLSSPIVWQTIATNLTYAGPLTPTNGWFSYLDTGSPVAFGTLRFYQLILTGVSLPASPSANPVPLGGIIATNGGFLLTWTAPTNDLFNLRWATNIVPPVNWTALTNIITSTNTSFSFFDTNTPLLMKFYQLILLP